MAMPSRYAASTWQIASNRANGKNVLWLVRYDIVM